MSGFDENPFGEPNVSSDPFAVSVSSVFMRFPSSRNLRGCGSFRLCELPFSTDWTRGEYREDGQHRTHMLSCGRDKDSSGSLIIGE